MKNKLFFIILVITLMFAQIGLVKASINNQAQQPFLGPLYYGMADIWQIFDHDRPLFGQDDGNDHIMNYDGLIYGDGESIPFGYGYDQHRGIDYGLLYQPVLAAANGMVCQAGWSDPSNHRRSYGLHIRIKHADADGNMSSDCNAPGYTTIYAHLSTLTVRTGQDISPDPSKGSGIIGISGNTGFVFDENGAACPNIGNDSTDWTCGAHLHFEVRDFNQTAQATNPYGWIGQDQNPPVQDPWSATVVSVNLWEFYPSITTNQFRNSGNPVGSPLSDFPEFMVVDDGDSGYTEIPSDCMDDVPGGYGNGLHRSVLISEPSCKATWSIQNQENNPGVPGEYDVYVYIPTSDDITISAKYTIVHKLANGTIQSDEAIVVQEVYPNDYHVDGWVYIGRYYLSLDGSENIEMDNQGMQNDDAGSNTIVVADAIKLVYTNDTSVPTPTPTATPQPAAGQLTCYSDNPSVFDCVQIDPYTVRWNIIGNPYNAPNITGQFNVEHPNQPVYVTAHWEFPQWVNISPWQTNPKGHYGIIGLPSVYVNDGGFGTPCSSNPDQLCGNFPVGTWDFIQPAVTNSFKRATVGFQIYPDPSATVYWTPQNSYLIVSSVGYGGVPATPGPTPTLPPTATPTPTQQPTSTPVPDCPCPLDDIDNGCIGGASSNNRATSFHKVSYTIQQALFDIQLFHRVEDEILSSTPQGQHYIDLYYEHGIEITNILRGNPSLRDEAVATIQLWEPNLQALVDGNGNTATITGGQVQAIQDFLDHLSALASPALQQTIAGERVSTPLEAAIGMPMDQAWLYLNGFPSTPVLDDFNRANGAIGGNWSGNPSKYSISSNQLLVTSNNSNSDIYWSNQAFGADQEVYVTFANVKTTATEQDLILKSQSNTTWGNGMIEVVYEAPANRVQVWTWEWPQGWVQHGADIPVTFVNGDTFGARALANGSVEVYKNGMLLGTRDVTSWSYYAQGGYVGLWFIGANGARLDDFGGGTLSSGAQSLMANSNQVQANGVSVGSFDAQVSGTSAFWQGIPLNETASVTIAQIQTNKQTLSPKPKSNGVWGEGVVQVFYDLANGRIQVWVYDSAKGWTQIGKDIPVKFSVGDQFTVRTFADGRLEILRDEKLVAKTDVTP